MQYLRCPSDIPRALGQGPTRILAVVVSADYPLHGNLAVLFDDR